MCRRYMEDIKCRRYSPVQFANFVYFCRTAERLITFEHSGKAFPPVLHKSIQNLQISLDYIFHIL